MQTVSLCLLNTIYTFQEHMLRNTNSPPQYQLMEIMPVSHTKSQHQASRYWEDIQVLLSVIWFQGFHGFFAALALHYCNCAAKTTSRGANDTLFGLCFFAVVALA